MAINTVLKQVKNKVSPSLQEKREMEKFLKDLLNVAKKLAGKTTKPMFCGSVAKNTWLSHRREADLFFLYPEYLTKIQLEKQGLSLAKKIVKKMNGKWKIAYAEHPYLSAKIPHNTFLYDLDIVPCYDIKNPSKTKSAVDRTPHHVRYINRKLPKSKVDDVRLLKQFCIGNKCYGADLKVRGFSGYLCELLILKFNSFLNCIKQAKNWHVGEIITFTEKPKQKTKTPLYVVDPVDPNRNVAAAVSSKTFYSFVSGSKEFLKQGKIQNFFPKISPLDINKIKDIVGNRKTRFYLIKYKRPDVLDDIVWSQMRRASKRLTALLEENGFKVHRKEVWADNKHCVMLFELSIWQVSKIRKHLGPRIYSKKQAKSFLRHYKRKNVFVENDRWAVELERKYTTVLHNLRDFFTQTTKQLLLQGMPNKLAPEMKKAKTISGKEFLTELKKINPEFRSFLRDYFKKR